MRAGLLSQPEVIQRINRQFVSTSLPYVDLRKFAATGDVFAQEVLRNWTTPVSLLFLAPEGKVLSKLSTLTDLNEVHPDTSRRPEAPQYHSLQSEVTNTRVFLKHLDRHF